MRILVPFAFVIALAGCGIPESVRVTNALDRDAANWIADKSPDPAIDRAAKAIADGSTLIARKIGEPEIPVAYTPEAHEQAVAQGNKDVDAQEAVKKGIGGFLSGLLTKVADFAIPGAGGALLGAFLWIRKNLQFNRLKAGIAPIIATIEKMPAVKTAVADYAGKIGAGAAVKAVVDISQK